MELRRKLPLDASCHKRLTFPKALTSVRRFDSSKCAVFPPLAAIVFRMNPSPVSEYGAECGIGRRPCSVVSTS